MATVQYLHTNLSLEDGRVLAVRVGVYRHHQIALSRSAVQRAHLGLKVTLLDPIFRLSFLFVSNDGS